MLSHAMKTPELALSEKESETLANAAANVARHYNLAASQKAMDWGNFIIALSICYGPRMIAIGERRKSERKAKDAPVNYGLQAA